MRALAEYIMRGRFQAILAATLATGTAFFAWVGAAIVALVILRRGFEQGKYVLAWALLPALMWMAGANAEPLATVLATSVVAMVLRATASWPWALVGAVAAGLVAGALVMAFGESYLQQLEQMAKMASDILAQWAGDSPVQSQLPMVVPTKLQFAGGLGLSTAFSASVSLILARWWQATLYNPGGFREEFVTLRLTPQLTLILLVIGCTFVAMGSNYWSWALIFAIPLTFAGFALVHAIAQSRQISNSWLVAFYLFWLLLQPLKMLLLIAAVADSWLDIRTRLTNRSQ
jgi:MFS family permease